MPTVTQRTRTKRQRTSPALLGPEIPTEPIWRISVSQYHEMIKAGIFGPDDPIELLEGWLVRKMAKDPPHAVANELVRESLVAMLPKGWTVRIQAPVTLGDSEPEPDLAVVRGSHRDFLKRHPEPQEVGIAVEVSASSLQRDKSLKKGIYARAGIEQYWILNLKDSTIEVFGNVDGDLSESDYQEHQVYKAKQRVPVVLDGKKVGSILVADVLP